MTYYWNPQQGQPQTQTQTQTPFPSQGFPTSPQQPMPMPLTFTYPTPTTNPLFRREESYIENILRLNRGKPGNFYFTFENAIGGNNTREVRAVVEAAGRDHVILRELSTDHRFLFPMVYFDYAEFDEELSYFNQTP